MKVKIYAKDLTVSQKDQDRIETKLGFLDKYLMIDSETIAQVVAKKNGNDVKLEITIPSKVGTLRSEVTKHDFIDAIDQSVDKLENQIRKQKTRLSRRHKEKLAVAFAQEIADEQPTEEVTKVKRVVVDEQDVSEAILQMELLGHDFYAYRDRDSKLICIVYRKKDGTYGILEVA